jgi:hypothetical protein
MLRGNVKVADRHKTTGEPGAVTDVGEAPVFDIAVEVKFIENMNTSGAVSEKDLHVAGEQTGKVMITVKEHTKENLEMAVWGVTQTTPETDVVASPMQMGLEVGKEYFLPGRPLNVSDLSVEDSTPVNPIDLVLGTHYTANLTSGLIKILAFPVGVVQPIRASFTKGEVTDVGLLAKKSKPKFIFLEGINIADDDAPIAVELFKGSFSPAKKIGLKGKEAVEYEYEVELLADTTKPRDAVLGRYGRIRTPTVPA